jgi:hypothetical protein
VKVYIGQTGHSIEIRVKEYHCHIQLYHLGKLAVVKHSINMGDWILLNDTSILAKQYRCMYRIVRERTEIVLRITTSTQRMGSP